MSDDHDHSHHDHDHDHGHEPAPGDAPLPEDAGSQALSESLRSSFAILKFVMIFLVLLFLGSGFFKVEQQKRAVILRFGKVVVRDRQPLLGPGLHWSFPYPIDEVVKIPFSEFQTVNSTVGWYNTTPEKEKLNQEDQPGPSLNPAVDGYAITADGNIIHTRASLLYRVAEPLKYEFNFKDAAATVQNALDNALLFAASRFKVDDILTGDVTRFQEVVRARVVDLLDRENLGIVVEQCQVESKPPRQLKQVFDNVLAAVSMRDKVHNEALSYENTTLSRATADAAGITNRAESSRVTLVQSIKAEAEQFSALLPKYEANPALFANIFLSEKIAQVLTNVQDKIYLPERADGKTRELRLQLSREPQAPKPAAGQAPPNP